MGTTPSDTAPVSVLDGGLASDAASPSDTERVHDAGLTADLIINAQDHELIDNYFAGQIERLNLVGLAAAVVDQGEIRYFKAWGQADREQGINADPRQTLWRLASLSKGVTGVIATRLAQRQAIDLDAPLPNPGTWKFASNAQANPAKPRQIIRFWTHATAS